MIVHYENPTSALMALGALGYRALATGWFISSDKTFLASIHPHASGKVAVAIKGNEAR